MDDVARLLLPWERLLWHQRARSLSRTYYALTDFRLIRVSKAGVVELALHDIGEVQRSESIMDRILGTSTIVVGARAGQSSIAMERVVGGAQLAGLLEWIAGDPASAHDPEAVRAALAWRPTAPGTSLREPLVGLAVIFALVGGLAIGLHGKQVPIRYSSAEAIYPSGLKRDRPDIERFMETEVLPWARAALGPIVGGEERVSCATCHGRDAVARDWRMPSVSRLPEPILAFRGWEQYSRGMDPQTRNAVYGYLAESNKQATAGYMREVVMPGMARLLGRPAYDFTKSYDHNRTQHAFGCYHCHAMD